MIEKIFGSRVGSKIIMHMGRRPYREFYLNELSTELKIGLGRTKTILDNLTGYRVLLKRTSGNRHLFRLNPNNQLTLEVIRLSNLDRFLRLPERFRTAINRFMNGYKHVLEDGLVSIILFGSVAKGTAKSWSDMDILVIVKNRLNKKTREDLRKIDHDISDIFSEISQEHLLIQKDFKENYMIGDDFLINIMSDGIILFDNDDFYSNYLLKGIPEVTKKSIKKVLGFAKKRLDECAENHKKFPEATASMLSGVSINLSRAVLLLKHTVPGSKHEIPEQLKRIDENKLAAVYKKTRRWFDEMPLEVDKDDVLKIIMFLKEKYRQASKSLEDWK